jgi:hypothetical protein
MTSSLCTLPGGAQSQRRWHVDRGGINHAEDPTSAESTSINWEHGLGRDLHVVPDLKVGEEGHNLHVVVHLEANIGVGLAQEYEPDDVLGDDIEPRHVVGGCSDDADA